MNKFYIFILFVLTSLSGCSKPEKKIEIAGHTMGTSYHIIVIASVNSSEENQENLRSKLKLQIDNLLIIINKQMSTYQKDSEISNFNQYRKSNWFNISKDFSYVVEKAQEISKKTNGAFDITVSPFVELWGFGSKIQYSIPTQKQLRVLLAHTGYLHLKVRKEKPALIKDNPSLKIDLSAIAKGFAVDKIADYLSEQGFDNYLVEIGGEIQARGKNDEDKHWQVAIEQPEKKHTNITSPVNKIISISDEGLATSGDYRNYYIKDGVRFSHMINPKTGRPITHKLASVTIIHKSTMIADAYATAVMVMGEKEGKEFILKNNIKANMIIRAGDKFISWSNLLH